MPSAKPGEFVVYHFNAKTLVQCTADGAMLTRLSEGARVFDNLSQARSYCQQKVDTAPQFGCTIQDHERKVVDQIFSTHYHERTRRTSDPKRQIPIGILLLIAGVFLIWIDAKHSWMLVIGFLVGARLAIGGLVRVSLALMGLRRTSG